MSVDISHWWSVQYVYLLPVCETLSPVLSYHLACISVGELGLSIRSRNALGSERIYNIGDLVQKSDSDLLQIRNFGVSCLYEVHRALARYKLSLKGQPCTNP